MINFAPVVPVDMAIPAAERRAAHISNDMFPERAKALEEFRTQAHIPHASAIPEIARKGVMKDFAAAMHYKDDESDEEGTSPARLGEWYEMF